MRDPCPFARAIALILPLMSAAAWGQQTDLGIQAQEDALRRIQQADERRSAEGRAARYQHIQGGPVSLAEIMRDPDNIELNYRYAQTQVADGNLRNAGATLERILLLNPNLHRIRLFYAFVLYRLDNLTEARAELAKLDTARLSPGDQVEAARLSQRIENRTRPTVFTAHFGAGMTYQTNANFAPDGELAQLLIPTPFGTISALAPVEEEDDIGYVGVAGIGFRHDIGRQDWRELFGSVNAVFNEQVTVDETDYFSVRGNFGVLHRSALGDLRIQAIAGNFRLADDSFLKHLGADIDLERRYFGGTLETHLRHRTQYEDYDSAGGFTPERTGYRHEFEAGARYRVAGNQLVGGSVQYTLKRARQDWREYDEIGISGDHTWLAGRGIFVINTVSYAHQIYDAPNPRVSTRRRHDNEFRYRFTVSSPLSNIFGRNLLSRAFYDVRLRGSIQYADTSSNIINFDHNNVSAEVFLNKRFSF